MPFSSSTWITPMCEKPRAAPPPSARPMRGGRGGGLGVVAESVTGWEGVGAGSGTLWHAARRRTRSVPRSLRMVAGDCKKAYS